MKVLITGASGFVGGALVTRLAANTAVSVRAASRGSIVRRVAGVDHMVSPELSRDADWVAAVRDCDVVVHAAARVHVMHDRAVDPLSEFRRVNVAGTTRLAEQAASAGVRRFVFVSSVKVNGEDTTPGAPFTASSTPAPCDPYGVSKWEAELALHDVSARTGLDVTIVRPVLVYGPGVGANFQRLMQALLTGIPLPFGAVRNRRSLVAIDNVTSVIERMLTHPQAAGRTFLVSDDDDMSTPELLRRVAHALGTTPRLLSVPNALLRGLASIAGQADAVSRLLDSLQVDITDTKSLLGWRPPVSVDEALAATTRHFLTSRS